MLSTTPNGSRAEHISRSLNTGFQSRDMQICFQCSLPGVFVPNCNQLKRKYELNYARLSMEIKNMGNEFVYDRIFTSKVFKEKLINKHGLFKVSGHATAAEISFRGAFRLGCDGVYT